MNQTKKEAQFKYRIDTVAEIIKGRFDLGDKEIDLKTFINHHCYQFLISKRTMKEIIEIAAARVPAKIEGGVIKQNGKKIQRRIQH